MPLPRHVIDTRAFGYDEANPFYSEEDRGTLVEFYESGLRIVDKSICDPAPAINGRAHPELLRDGTFPITTSRKYGQPKKLD